MPDLDVYPCTSLREALSAWQAASEADREAPSLTELAGLAGYAPSTLFNAVSGRRVLRAGLSLGRAMGLDLASSAHLSLLAGLDGAKGVARARLEERLARSRSRAHRAGLARGTLGALDTLGLRAALPVHSFGEPFTGARAMAATQWPPVSMARAGRALSDSHIRPTPWVNIGTETRELHQVALRRLPHALFEIPLEERRLRLSLWPAHPQAVAEVAALLDRRLDELIAGCADEEGPRHVLHLGARLIPVAQLPPDLAGLTPAWRAPALPAAPAPPHSGPRVMSYDRASTFLYDALQHRKSERPGRSYTTFGRRVGLAPSTLAGATRDRTINLGAAERVGDELGLSGDELRYFTLLVEQEVSDCPATRTEARTEMAELRARHGLLTLQRDGGWIDASWTALVMRALSSCPSFLGDPGVLAQALIPAVDAHEVHDALNLLTSLGLFELDANGTPRSSDKLVTMPEHTLQDAHLLRLLHAVDVAEHALALGAGWWSARLVSVPARRLRGLLNAIADLQREAGAYLAWAEQVWPADGVTMILLDATPWTRRRRR